MKSRSLPSALFVLALAAFTGCRGGVGVPQTKVDMPTPHGVARIRAPKDVDLTGLDITPTTNGPHIKIDRYKAKTNPKVVETAAEGQVQILDAQTRMVKEAFESGRKAGAAAAGLPIAP